MRHSSLEKIYDKELFKEYNCSGYYKILYDKTSLFLDKTTGKAYKCVSGSRTEEEIPSVNKKYFALENKSFNGIAVGFKDIVVEAKLAPQKTEDGYIVNKTIKKLETCAVVYYQNNRSHYVPLNMMQKVED